MAGYVKEHRDIMDHAVFQDAHLYKVFKWCVMCANFKDSNTKSGLVKRGSFTTGRIKASEQLNMTPSRVYRLLHKLQELGSVSITANSNWTTITVCNYETYQGDDTTERTTNEQPADSQRTADEQPADTRIRREEGKKGRRKEKRPPVSFEDCQKTCESVHVEISPVWHQWLTYKHERGDVFTETGLRSAVTHLGNQVKAHGTSAVSAAILKAMASGWAGWDHAIDATKPSLQFKPQPAPKKYLA